MSQKFIKKLNSNPRSMAYGKYFARAIYDKTFVGTKQLADFIQTHSPASAPTSQRTWVRRTSPRVACCSPLRVSAS